MGDKEKREEEKEELEERVVGYGDTDVQHKRQEREALAEGRGEVMFSNVQQNC